MALRFFFCIVVYLHLRTLSIVFSYIFWFPSLYRSTNNFFSTAVAPRLSSSRHIIASRRYCSTRKHISTIDVFFNSSTVFRKENYILTYTFDTRDLCKYTYVAEGIYILSALAAIKLWTLNRDCDDKSSALYIYRERLLLLFFSSSYEIIFENS